MAGSNGTMRFLRLNYRELTPYDWYIIDNFFRAMYIGRFNGEAAASVHNIS